MNHLKTIKFLFTLSLPLLIFSCDNNNPVPEVDTTLNIIVEDEAGNPVEGAEVLLFADGNDWSNKKNALFAAQMSDSQGKASYKKIEPVEYWINIEKGNLNNWFTTTNTNGAIQEKKVTELKITIR